MFKFYQLFVTNEALLMPNHLHIKITSCNFDGGNSHTIFEKLIT